MKSRRLPRALGTVAVVCSGSLILCSSLAETVRRPRPSPAVQKAPQPIKVLVRQTHVIEIAFDGARFLDALDEVAKNAAPEARQRVSLASAGGPCLFVEEKQILSRGEAPGKWAKDPAEHEFLVEWKQEYTEHAKYNFSAPLSVSVAETWTVGKVSDPAVVQTWKASYSLRGTNISAPKEEISRKAVEQTETVVAPARGPIFQEIREFLVAHRAAAKERR